MPGLWHCTLQEIKVKVLNTECCEKMDSDMNFVGANIGINIFAYFYPNLTEIIHRTKKSQ